MSESTSVIEKQEAQFQESVQRGVEITEPNAYKFLDSGLSLASLLNLKFVKESDLVRLKPDNILDADWAREEQEPTERTILIPVPDLFGCQLGYQKIRLEREYKAAVPRTSTVIALLIAYYAKTKKWLIEDKYIRTCDYKDGDAAEITMGIVVSFHNSYFEVSYVWTGGASKCIGVAAEFLA